MSTPLPDAYAESRDGRTLLVANKKARKFLDTCCEPRIDEWSTVGGGVFTSPKYRAVEIEDAPGAQVILAAIHQAGLRVMFRCVSCPKLHTVDDATAERFLKEAEALRQRVMHPGVGTLQ
jgi:hypothetical protein